MKKLTIMAHASLPPSKTKISYWIKFDIINQKVCNIEENESSNYLEPYMILDLLSRIWPISEISIEKEVCYKPIYQNSRYPISTLQLVDSKKFFKLDKPLLNAKSFLQISEIPFLTLAWKNAKNNNDSWVKRFYNPHTKINWEYWVQI